MKVKLYNNYYFRKNEQDPVCDYLRAVRDKRTTKTKDIAKHGVATSTVSNLFSGKTRSPRFATVMVIARAIGPDGTEAVARCIREGGRRMKVIEGGKRELRG